MMINQKIIEQIVMEVVTKLEQHQKKRNLLVVNGSDNKLIETLEKYWKIIKISLPANIPEQTENAVFLHVSQDLLVKAALGIADTDESKVFSQLMMSGSSVTFIPSKQLEWLLESRSKKEMSQSYAAQLLNYKQIVETFGVKLLSITEFVSTNATETKELPFHKKLLTEKDVIRSKSNKIFIHKKTIVTPLARDSARELAKKIIVIE